ncbi:tetratricopeptide repeat protein [Candidatus Neptunochlamydia vexilliferae]|uniref:tetratricopeptide repeat protein n=1 Tax=Candidatus Neptunichlamydia vexilliferae TaxID=1651774 RepID=UPI0018913169|nr:tetratricopeptide repeat protein [Candidatus Neptunochlamydia vexilliferae]
MAISNQARSSNYLLHEVNLEEEITNIPHKKSSFFPLIQRIKTVENPPPFFSDITFPEKLILFEKKPLKTFDGEKLTPQSPLFINLTKLIDHLTQFTKQNPQSPIKTDLEKVTQVYQHYIKGVCQEKGRKRREKLKGPARIFGYLHGQVTCLELPQKKGRQLSSLTRYTQTVRINTFGASALQKAGKAFIKREYKNPLNPGYEYAIDAFNKFICGLGSSPSLLLNLSNLLVLDPFDERSYGHPLRKEFILEGKSDASFFTQNPDKKKNYPFAQKRVSYPAQVNLGVEGTSFYDFLKGSPNLDELDPYHYSAIVILALLTRPDDGRADNYIITSKKGNGRNIIGIDNDGALVSPIKATPSKEHLVLLRTTLFLLPNMKKQVNAKFAEEFLKISPETLLIDWLGALSKYNDKYTSMLKQGAFSPKDSRGLSLPIQLPLSELVTLYEAITKVQKALQDDPKITHKKLFQSLYPLVCDAYEIILKKAKGAPLKGQEMLFSQKNPPCFETLLPKVKIPPQEKVQNESLDKVLEFFLDGVMPKLSAKKQERLLRKILEVFPKTPSLSLSGIQVPEAKLSTTLIRAQNLQTLTLGKGQALSHSGLIKLMNEKPKLHLILKQGSFQASSLKPLIEYAQKHDRDLSYSIGGKCLPLKPNHYTTLLQKALLHGDLSLAETLTAFKAAISPAVTQELAQKGPPQALHFLKAHKIPLDALNSRKQNLLHLAAQAGKTANVEALLQLGLPIEKKDLEGRTPLHLATNQNHLDAVKLLVKKGASPSALTSSKESPLHLAAFRGHLPLVQFFLKTAPQSLVQGDSDGKAPLHRAMWGDPKPQVVKTLLAAGANPNAKNTYDYTPLHWAAKHGHFESARLLLGKKGDTQIANKNGDTPIDIALKWGQDAIFRLFLNPSYKKEVNATLSSSSSSSSSSNQDIEGKYYKEFEKAYDNKDVATQILYLEKMAAIALAKEDVIKGAHLLNAALAIVPSNNPSYQNYLFTKLETLEGLFLEAKFQVKTPSNHRNYLKKLREKLATIRAQVSTDLGNGQDVLKIQAYLTNQYQELLSKIIESSINLTRKKPPISFNIMGLGSMARHEMCPYSDVEFAIIVGKNTPEVTKYFKKLSQLIELRVTNLGETKWDILRPKRQSDGSMREAISLTPGGFSMDIGGLSPLGKPGVYELIGTPKELAAYQNPEWLQKHDGELILVNALTHGCYFMGDVNLLKTYYKEVTKWLDKREGSFFSRGSKERTKRALSMLKGHAEEFKPYLTDDRIDIRAYDIKRDLYRPLQMAIGGLLLYHGIESQGTLLGVKTLLAKKLISPEGAKHLSQALRTALTLRIQTHLFYKKEKEIFYFSKGMQDTDANELYLISKPNTILDIYRVLVPLNKAIKAFVQNPQTTFKNLSFYDKTLGTLDHSAEENLQYDKAEASYIQAVALNPNDITALHHLGHMKQTLGKVNDALAHTQENLRLLKQKHKAAPHPDVATALNNLGNAYKALGETEKAIDHYKQALAIDRKLYGNKPHPSIARGLNNLGGAYQDLGEMEKAIDHYNQALAIDRKLYGNKPHPSIATRLNNLGMAYNDLGETQKAIDRYNEALAIFRKLYGNKPHRSIAICLNNLGAAYNGLGETEKAIDHYKQALAIARKLYGNKPHPDIATDLNNLGGAYQDLGETEKAIDHYKQALAIFRKLYSTMLHPSIALCLNNLGAAYKDLGETQKAIAFYNQALVIDRKLYGNKPHPSIAADLNNLGAAYQTLGETEKAIDHFNQALAMDRKLYGNKPHPDIATRLSNLGSAYDALKQYGKAKDHFVQAHMLFVKVYGPNHPHTKVVKGWLDAVERKLSSSGSSSSSSSTQK